VTTPSQTNEDDTPNPKGRVPSDDILGKTIPQPRQKNTQTRDNPIKLDIGTYNCRTLREEDKVIEIENELENIKWDIIGLCETKRKGEELTELKSGHRLYNYGETITRTIGMGFLINKNIKNRIIESTRRGDRIVELTIQLNNRYKLKLIQVYAPTSKAPDEEIEAFYEDLDQSIINNKEHFMVIMGDFNAKIGEPTSNQETVGKFGLGKQNKRGELLAEFSSNHNLYIMNTFFKKSPKLKWTWRSPNGETKNEIDYFLCKNKNIFQDVTTLSRFNTGSDHRLVRAKLILKTKWERLKLIKNRKFNINNISNKKLLENEINKRFEETNMVTQNLEELNKQITDNLQKAAVTISSKEKPAKENKISKETLELLKKRREFKQDQNARTKIEYIELGKVIRKNMRKEIRAYNTKQIRETIEKNGNRKILRRRLNQGRRQIVAIAEKDGNITRNTERIVNRIQEFYTELYRDNTKNIVTNNTMEFTNQEDNIPKITKVEIKDALRLMKNNKCPGEDQIGIELIKMGGDRLLEHLTTLFNLCLEERNIPTNWKNASLILIHKKGSIEEMKNYRPISLLSNLYKTFTKLLTTRLTPKLDSGQPVEQAGFRRGFSPIDHIHTLRQIVEKRNEFQRPLCMAFIDYEKAFDSLKTKAISEALTTLETEKIYIDLIQNIYENATATFMLNGIEGKIKLEKGIRQGDALSPKLFTAALQLIFDKIKWNKKGIKINNERISHLRYADDIVILSKSPKQLKTMIEELNKESKKIGLKINCEKTKIMFNKFINPIEINIEDYDIENVKSFNYLGQIINIDGGIEEEIKRRIQLAWVAFGKLSNIFRSEIPLNLKKETYNQCILPVLSYAAETWTLTKKQEQKIQVTQRRMERIMLGITLKDKKRNTWIRQQTKITDALTYIKKSKWRWAGHIARREDGRWSKLTTFWIPDTGQRKRGRPRERWKDEVERLAGKNWKRKAKDRERWKKLGEAFVQQWTESG
jgi:hypothetical protein